MTNAIARVLAALAFGLGPGGAAATQAPPPRVFGPRDTTSLRPVYSFAARGAIAFRCAFDSRFLHPCPRRYSEALEPGAHVLRVRAVLRGGTLTRLGLVRVRVRLPVPELRLGAPIQVGNGAGVPAAGAGAIWVPVTGDGTVARVDPASQAVTGRVRVAATAGGPGDLDSAVFAGGALWIASDAAGTIARVDPATNAVTATIPTAPRPAGLAEGAGFVWAFHFRRPTVTRIDAATGAVRAFEVEGLTGTGIAYGDGSVWVLSERPARVFRLDPATGAVRATIALETPFPVRRAFVETWWLSYGDGALWAALANSGGVARVDVATGALRAVRIGFGDPFGVAVGGGAVWVATDRAVWKLDAATGQAQAASPLPRAGGFGFVSVVYAEGAAWLTMFDRGTLVRVTGP
jgi:streptogramin lyase